MKKLLTASSIFAGVYFVVAGLAGIGLVNWNWLCFGPRWREIFLVTYHIGVGTFLVAAGLGYLVFMWRMRR